jgi:3-hydroxybutyryl-CoA dehydrogenase
MRVAVIGAGIMGTGIAEVCAEAGLDVALQSRSRATLDRALDRMRTSQQELLANGLLTESAAAAALGRVHTTQDLAAAVDAADFVSENIPEDLGLKQTLFLELDRLAPPAAILSTNTSGLPITAIATGVARPARVVGFHWLNPPQLTIAVEVTRGARTSDATMRAALAFAERVGRRPIRVERDVPGFLWNRLQMALVREAVHVVEQGIASPEDVDLAIELGLGLRWAAVGPFRIMDLAGIATFRAVAAYVYPELSTARAPQALLDRLVHTGATGARAGRGFYQYPPGAHDALIRARDARLMALGRVVHRFSLVDPEAVG